MLLKLYALPPLYRRGDFTRVAIYESDIASLMHAYLPNMESLFRVLNEHLLQTDISALQEIVSDIERKIEHFNKRFDSES